jgi:hypothetical protein
MSKKLATLLTTIILVSVLLSAHSRPGNTGSARPARAPDTSNRGASASVGRVAVAAASAGGKVPVSPAAEPVPPPTPPPTNVQVSSSDNGSSTLDNDTTENEPSAAATSGAVVVGWNDSRQVAASGWGGVNSITGFGFSTNGGASFTDAGSGGFAPPSGLIHLGDPALAADSAGNFYFASLAVDNVMSLTGSRVTVAKSTSTSPVVFGTPVTIPGILTSGAPFEDKELIAVDNSNPAGPFSGRVYVAWSEFASMFDATPRVLFTHSTSTSPLTFAAPQALTPADALNHGAMPAVGPGGAVYVVWGRFAFSGGSISSESIRLLKSTDGGVTFVNPDPSDPSPDKVVASPTPPADSMTSGGIAIRSRGFPYVAVDRTATGSPTRGYVYIVYQADPDGAGPDRSDIFFTRSVNGGRTWSTPRSINAWPAVVIGNDTTTNDNFSPSIAVSPDTGQITVSFNDRRNDTSSADGDPANTKIAIVRAVSTDAGATWFNDQVSTVASRPSTGYDPAFVSNSIGDYIYTVSEGSNFHSAWTDFRNNCNPPAGAAAPCSPSSPARSDQDIFYAKTSVLTGPDMAITPWGYVTGVGPLWQTPDIFVVDALDNQINAAKGTVNRLRARVHNVGNAAASGVVIRFKFAPIFAGLTDAAFKQIGVVTENFTAAGDASGNDHKTIPINWDLTNTADTNGGLWPQPVSAFEHFCVRVSVELASDVNMSNNGAQNNFVDVGDAAIQSPVRFMIGNPSRERVANARLVLDLPKNVRAKVVGFPADTRETVRLKPGEIRIASVTFVPGEDYRKYPPAADVVASVSLEIDGKLVGGFSMRLAKSKARPRDEGTAVEKVAKNPNDGQPAPHDRPFKEGKRGAARIFKGDRDAVFKTILAVLNEMKEPVSLANRERGLINTASIQASNGLLREIISPEFLPFLGRQDGRYLLSFLIESQGGETKVTITPLIVVSMPAENPLGGRPVPSNGTLEKQHFERIARRLG